MATFNVISKTSGTKYLVDTMDLSCTCPHYLYRLQGTGQLCKHIKEVVKNSSKYKQTDKVEKISNLDTAINFIEKDNEAVNFIEKFGEDKLKTLIKNGEIYENHGRLKIL